jgi:hypothetical protein
MNTDELLFWAEHDGAWYQYRDPDTGRLQVCYLGFCTTYSELRDYGREHGIPVELFKLAQHHAARAATAQRQGCEAFAAERELLAR